MTLLSRENDIQEVKPSNDSNGIVEGLTRHAIVFLAHHGGCDTEILRHQMAKTNRERQLQLRVFDEKGWDVVYILVMHKERTRSRSPGPWYVK